MLTLWYRYDVANMFLLYFCYFFLKSSFIMSYAEVNLIDK